MDKRLRIMFKYLISLSGLLILLGVICLLISGYRDWHNLIENFGLAFTAAGITTFLFKFDLSQMISDNGIRDSGMEAIKHGRNAMLEYVGSLEAFLRKARPREIDICGIAMYSFFEPHSLYDLLIQLASEGYRVRIAFAHPMSAELALQEEAEHKPKSLKYHIEYIVEQISKRLGNARNKRALQDRFAVVLSPILPKAFVLRAGSKMIVSEYFLRGPHFSPTYLLSDVPEGIFEAYREYLDDVFSTSELVVASACSSGCESDTAGSSRPASAEDRVAGK